MISNWFDWLTTKLSKYTTVIGIIIYEIWNILISFNSILNKWLLLRKLIFSFTLI